MTKFKSLKNFAAVLFALGSVISSTAQVIQPPKFNPNAVITANDSLNNVENPIVNSDASVLLQNQVSFADVDYPYYDDSILNQRINSLQSGVPLVYNSEVRTWINLYVEKRRNSVSQMVGLSKIYFPVFDEVFSSYGIPTELKYLSIIESALNPNAVSRCGATGTWQFMYYTAKLYGLQINSYVDERKDLFKATDAAARYLKEGYARYGDWLLSIASYNCGAGNVDLAITRSGGKCSFWEIEPWLPKETRGYVPAFIAAAYVMNYYELHNIIPTDPIYDFASLGSVDVSSKLSFDQISKYTDVPVDQLKFLNPGYKTNVIPTAASCTYCLSLPADKLTVFNDKKDSIITASQNAGAYSYYTASNTPYTNGYISYYVKPGESLGVIASKHGVYVSQLKAWNNLKSDLIYPNQKLLIYSKTYTPPTTSTVAKTTTPATTSSTKVVYYTVKYGDTLWGITQKYSGLTIDTIKVNNPTKANNLQPGMVLKLPVKP